MKKLIREQIGQLKKLEDKVLLKDLLNGVFMGLYEKNEEMYQNLEQRVFEEIEYESNDYTIYTTLVEKSEYDDTHYLLAPLLMEDIKDNVYNLSELLESTQAGNPYLVMKVFLKCDYLLFQEILLDKQPFSGVIFTDRKSYSASFTMELNTQYWERVYKLYRVFLKNGIPWNTINIPYISRVVNIFLEKTDEKIPEKEEIQEIKIDFGQYNHYIEYDLIPVWNVKELVLESTGFPIPCEDHINYEHTITTREYGEENGYLVEEDKNIQYVRHKKGSLSIVARTKESKDWKVYMVVNEKRKKLDFYTYPLMSNKKRESFTEKLNKKSQRTIKTRAELIRFFQSFQFDSYLEFRDLKILNKNDNEKEETYNMNFFILDEIRDSEYTKRLVLYFQAKDRNFFLIRDLMSFLISEVQLMYPEYHCEGKLL